VLELKNEDFSRDAKAVEALNNDPLTVHEVQPAMTVAAFVRADERVREEFSAHHAPSPHHAGTDDRATVCHGSRFFHETAGSKDKTLKLYEAHYHDLLNDIGKEEVMADITGWIDRHVTA
jgi:acylglycerol lipase